MNLPNLLLAESRPKLVAAILLFPVACSFGQDAIVPSERLQAVMSSERPLVIAHRGYSMAAPENTLPALELGVLSMADLVEFDYFHTQDGVPVVMHDSTLDRTTNSVAHWGEERITVWSKTMEELRELDAGTWFRPWFQGVGVPTVAEALDVIQPGSISLVERKHGDAATVIELLKEKEMIDDVVVQAFDWEFITDCNKRAPGLVLGALGPPRQADGSRYPPEERYLNDYFLDRIETAGAGVVGWSHRWVTPEGIRAAHDRGIKVWLYTINDLDTTLQFLELGVDGIISDNPAMVWKALMRQAR